MLDHRFVDGNPVLGVVSERRVSRFAGEQRGFISGAAGGDCILPVARCGMPPAGADLPVHDTKIVYAPGSIARASGFSQRIVSFLGGRYSACVLREDDGDPYVHGLLRRADAALAASAAASIRLTIAVDRITTAIDGFESGPNPLDGASGAQSTRFTWTRRSIVDARGRRRLLTDTEWRLLHLLVSARGRTLTAEEISARLWAPEVHRRSEVEVYVSRLRRKFGGDRQSVIEAVRGEGYRFVAVDSGDQEPGSPGVA